MQDLMHRISRSRVIHSEAQRLSLTFHGISLAFSDYGCRCRF